ncbi:hypothetical protein BKA82DRAFT_997541 [Pisolithus tinctorius]|uniref:Homeobox domain-containing protein n=1 Tax=Pisolithus tinctorius Marx 270 TaxID=870435 RepID=A0A0C3PK76_PISTI|nr:hypothetical protein BKA82DRAFT_997541 [Pisolithus tinctorius]KIO08619.1 hypothetical protein M404DRAFT_997541 [Pisolithus tinctorius Marx 270]
MDAEIRQRLIDAQGGLLSALSDENLLLPFHSTWSKLQVDISDMNAQGILTQDTLALAHVVASRISTVSQCYLDLKQTQDSLRAGFARSGKGFLAGLCPASASSTSPVQSAEERCVPFIATTSKWLLEHIHNPYPSPQFKASVAEACCCSPNSVNSWFIGARRRIGWTSLCREQFRNCRADAVDAAYRALVRPDPVRPLPAAIIEAFVTVKANAEGLYSFTKHATAIDRDAVVNDTVECGTRTLTTEGSCQQEMFGRQAEIHTYHEDQRSETTIYPSPFSSSPPPASAIPTLVPSFSDESDDEDQDVAPLVLAGRKRRANIPDSECAVRTERPKRLCTRPSRNPSINASEPPSPSSDEGTTSSETEAIRALPRSRKRRLSEGAERNVPKRPHGLPVTLRSQAVSDPLPRITISNESDIEDWFQTNFQTLFDLPAPVECSDLDPSTQWEVLFGGYSIPSASVPSDTHLMHSPPTFPEAVLQDVQECSGDFSVFDDLFLPLGNEACEDALLKIRSSAPHLSPEHQFALPNGTSSVEGVSFLDDWVTFCESTPQPESVGTHAPFEPNFFEFPDLSVSQPAKDSRLGQVALVLGDIGLPVGA